ncbi:MAG: ubiquinol-cytochrome C chaperone family protein [Rhodovibrio sp.]|nr:ubiquinol-cytochrome C chaperone family protein [Rhodovibrio sp.]
MKLAQLFRRRRPEAKPAAELYAQAVAQARQAGFYTELEVPDTLDGRFELVSLHVYLILRRLRADHRRTARLAQALFDEMFEDMDGSVRELGAGDLGVGPRVKKMARNFYGRIKAYDAGLDGSRAELREALRRNLYGNLDRVGEDTLDALAGYMAETNAALAETALEGLMQGQVDFARLAPAPERATEQTADGTPRSSAQTA